MSWKECHGQVDRLIEIRDDADDDDDDNVDDCAVIRNMVINEKHTRKYIGKISKERKKERKRKKLIQMLLSMYNSAQNVNKYIPDELHAITENKPIQMYTRAVAENVNTECVIGVCGHCQIF